MNIRETIDTAVVRHKFARRRNLTRRKASGKASASGIFLVFKDKMAELGFGQHGMLTKKEFNMLSGFIKVSKNNGLDDADIYSLVEKVVDSWQSLRSKVLQTKKGIKWVLPDRPSIRDFLVCRDAILNEIADKPVVQESMPLEKAVFQGMTYSPVKRGPTQQEIDEEYMKLMGEYDE